jgi:hypothetical protein
VARAEEVAALDDLGHLGHPVGLDEQGTEQRPLGLVVVRRDPPREVVFGHREPSRRSGRISARARVGKPRAIPGGSSARRTLCGKRLQEAARPGQATEASASTSTRISAKVSPWTWMRTACVPTVLIGPARRTSDSRTACPAAARSSETRAALTDPYRCPGLVGPARGLQDDARERLDARQRLLRLARLVRVQLRATPQHRALVVLRRLDGELAGQEVVPGVPGRHLHHVAALAEVLDVFAQEHFDSSLHVGSFPGSADERQEGEVSGALHGLLQLLLALRAVPGALARQDLPVRREEATKDYRCPCSRGRGRRRTCR